jgi:hypothetical protein
MDSASTAVEKLESGKFVKEAECKEKMSKQIKKLIPYLLMLIILVGLFGLEGQVNVQVAGSLILN